MFFEELINFMKNHTSFGNLGVVAVITSGILKQELKDLEVEADIFKM